MTGRVVQLPIEFWSKDELLGISRDGFAALRVVDPSDILGTRLADESFRCRAPCLGLGDQLRFFG